MKRVFVLSSICVLTGCANVPFGSLPPADLKIRPDTSKTPLAKMVRLAQSHHQNSLIEIEKLSNALKIWISNQAKAEIELEDGTKKEVISNAGLDLINKLKTNPKQTLEKLKMEGNVSKKFNFDNFDLITWLIIS